MFTRQVIIQLVEKLYASAQANHLPLEKILLFGSYAKGNPHKYSDIDLAIFSSAFVENPFQNIDMIQCLDRVPQMQLHLYPLHEYNEHPFVEEIKKHAIVLKDNPM